ncbi:ScbA/BarX family gamma-butyrolactone biosynthesis protein [Streptomyces soliscabiei]|uniref:ScbA/BarX family gamma-butyrolactone biosynthesis protein n=1 Tax=Streptomyces soliscabiei TaxID=588897 RepID=UPI0029A3E145|nr:ScbA/BarX family gamma-butyrolactone biosynthesis protein [Streptomyces sp. NY05-11A]MDX2680435.1 ScbA/BarX family gamma-butyrolactone biosynthesis protein [Streptomyces sp. NY05-11A]
MTASTFQDELTAFGAETGRCCADSTLRSGRPRPATLTSTVPRELVHRSAVAEVLLTGWRRVDDTRFVISAQWPRGHSFFTPVADGRHDPLIGCETLRQIGILLGHAEFGVPFGHQFLIQDLHFAVRPQHLEMGYEPAALSILITCTKVVRRGENLSRMRFEAVFHRDGQVAATGGGSFSCLTPKVYRRLRGAHVLGSHRQPSAPGSPTAPARVGRTSPMDVVLSPTGARHRWLLRADTRHPVLFEHAVDHVPGMVLIEAARQATAVVLGRPHYLPVSIASEFARYTELASPCTIEARPLPAPTPGSDRNVLVTAVQSGVRVFACTVTAAPHEG